MKATEERFKIDGREFLDTKQNITAAQDDYILVALTDSGAADTLLLIPGATKEGRKELLKKILSQILRSGHQHEVLAGVLTEVGKKWTRVEAESNALKFADVTDPSEKVVMRGRLVGFVLNFFLFGGVSSRTSPKSSNPNETDRDISNEEAAISENLPESSAPSPDTTPIASI